MSQLQIKVKVVRVSSSTDCNLGVRVHERTIIGGSAKSIEIVTYSGKTDYSGTDSDRLILSAEQAQLLADEINFILG